MQVKYKKIVERIEKSFYRDFFDAIEVNGTKYYYPVRKALTDEFRNLVILAVYPYVLWVARLIYDTYSSFLEQQSVIEIDDIIQECFYWSLRSFEYWDPEKGKFTYFLFNLCVWRVRNKFIKEEVQGYLARQSFLFLLNEYPDMLIDDFIEQKLIAHEKTDFVDRVEKRILFKELLKDCKKLLSEVEYLVLYLKLVEGMTYKEIGKKLGVSKQRVAQILLGQKGSRKSVKDKVILLKAKYSGLLNTTGVI